jgi:hypothetical protein
MEHLTKHRIWVKQFAGISLLVSCLSGSIVTEASINGIENYIEQSTNLHSIELMRETESILETELLAKADPDECFNGIGNEFKPLVEGECTGENEQPKVNAAYVWGLTQTDDYIWFGTMANTHCAVFGTYLGELDSSINDSWVCEGAQSQFPKFMADQTGISTFNLLGSMGLGDWRVPKMYRYDKNSGETEDITPPFSAQDYKLLQTVGLRSAGSLNGVVFLAGPSFTESGTGVNMFAFKDDEAHTYLGSHTFTEYDNIRKWIVADGVLYTAVGANNKTVEGVDGYFAGRVLRWTGDASNPFQFEEVGYLPGSGAELAVHENRLFVTTWPGTELATKQIVAGVYMGPILPEGGLKGATVWKEIWNASDYEADPVVALTYGGGAIASYDGYLYWGTMHVPGVATIAAAEAYGINTNDQVKYAELFLNTSRAISIYRSQSPASDTKVELLYGDTKLKAYDQTTKSFVDTDNNMGQPLWGASGFGNMFNNYTWTMQVYNNKLYIGTMDWSYLGLKSEPLLVDYLKEQGITTDPGADLWRIESSNGNGAIAEDLTGIGNYGSYGIRTILTDATNMYLGMANPMNLMTDLNDDKPEGGWELIKMTDPSLQPPVVTPPPATPTPTDQPVKKSGGGAMDLVDLSFLMILFGLFGLFGFRKKIYAKQ